MMYGYGYGMGIWMVVGWIVTATVVVFAIYGLILLLRRSDSVITNGKPTDPLDILKQRLAKGEIDTTDYQRIKEELLK